MLSDQTPSRKIRILLADDHRQVLEQLAARLSREPDFEVAGVTSKSRATLSETRAKHPDILLMDPFMRDGFGLATLRQIRSSLPSIIVVVLTAFVDTTLNIQLRKIGIKHILAKGVPFSRLVTELRAAAINFPRSSDGWIPEE